MELLGKATFPGTIYLIKGYRGRTMASRNCYARLCFIPFTSTNTPLRAETMSTW